MGEIYKNFFFDKNLKHYRSILLTGCCLSLFGGIAAMLLRWFPEFPGPEVSTSIMLALAAFGTSFVLGFLFGIPKVVQSNEGSADSKYHLIINTNLTEVSDWLTKIIIGVSLANIIAISGYIRRYAELFQPEPTDPFAPDSYIAFGLGATLYFLAAGLISGYIVTRLYLAQLFSLADRAAVSGDISKRMVDIENRLKLHSRVEYLSKVAKELCRKDKCERAEILIQAAKRMDPGNESTLLAYAYISDKRGHTKQAVEIIKELLRYHPDSPQGSYDLARYLLVEATKEKGEFNLSEEDRKLVISAFKNAFEHASDYEEYARSQLNHLHRKVDALIDTAYEEAKKASDA